MTEHAPRFIRDPRRLVQQAARYVELVRREADLFEDEHGELIELQQTLARSSAETLARALVRVFEGIQVEPPSGGAWQA
ncbi:MAG: hypothetical protein EOM91_20000 [Sphingobacteriia bacterium]|nr:hypothetical protein [Sphingobacteriia bacterium]